MPETKLIRGHCFCRAIQFELTRPTEMCSHCHCESCRRSHGAAFVTWTSVPDGQFQFVKGEERLKKYESSENIFWMFCGDCGTPLFQTTRHSPGRIYVTVASLTAPLDRAPDSHVSFEEKVDWITVNDDLPCYREKASDRVK